MQIKVVELQTALRRVGWCRRIRIARTKAASAILSTVSGWTTEGGSRAGCKGWTGNTGLDSIDGSREHARGARLTEEFVVIPVDRRRMTIGLHGSPITSYVAV